MNWLALIAGLLKLVNVIAEYASRRQLIKAGEAQAIAEGLQATLSNIERARKAADAVKNPRNDDDRKWADGVSDRFRRDDE